MNLPAAYEDWTEINIEPSRSDQQITPITRNNRQREQEVSPIDNTNYRANLIHN